MSKADAIPPLTSSVPVQHQAPGPSGLAALLSPDGGQSLAVRGLSVRFGGVFAVRNVDFDVAPGELVAIIGPNGAGKSTLLNAVSGFAAAIATGTVQLDGDDCLGMKVASMARLGVGRSFQDPVLVEGSTVLENVLTGGFLRRGHTVLDQVLRWAKTARAEQALAERAYRLLDVLELSSLADRPAASLSYGARKRVDVARALLSGPRVLLLDEPTSGLDRSEQAKMLLVLEQLRDSHAVTVVLVEHHMDLVRAVASRVVGLQAGEVLAFDSPAAVLDSPDFRAALVGAAAPADHESV